LTSPEDNDEAFGADIFPLEEHREQDQSEDETGVGFWCVAFDHGRHRNHELHLNPQAFGTQ
jgi:hypothetical protein